MEDIRFLKEKEYDELYHLRRSCFDVLTEKQEAFCRQHYYDEINWMGLFEDEKLVSVVWMKPLQQHFNGHLIPAAGLGSVATHADYRYKGYARKLIEKAHKEMKKRGYVLSSLAPFLQSFYEKFDYVQSSTFLQLTYDMKEIDKKREYINEKALTIHDVKEIMKLRDYQLYHYQLTCYRDEEAILQSLYYYQMRDYLMTGYGEEGFIVYKEGDNDVKIIEVAYKSIEGLKKMIASLCHRYMDKDRLIVISPCDQQIKRAIGINPQEEKRHEDKMTRIIDVKKVMQLTDFKQPVVIKIADKVYDVSHQKVQLTKKTPDVICTIKAFTAYILGVKTMDQLVADKEVKMSKKINMDIQRKTIFENEVY